MDQLIIVGAVSFVVGAAASHYLTKAYVSVKAEYETMKAKLEAAESAYKTLVAQVTTAAPLAPVAPVVGA